MAYYSTNMHHNSGLLYKIRSGFIPTTTTKYWRSHMYSISPTQHYNLNTSIKMHQGEIKLSIPCVNLTNYTKYQFLQRNHINFHKVKSLFFEQTVNMYATH